MKITVIGTGYVGLITGVGYASQGHDVNCIDIVQEKIDMINSGTSPLYEEGLEELLKEVLQKEHFRAHTNLEESIQNSDVSFICVGTPSKENGEIDLSFIQTVSEQLGKALKNKSDYHVVIVKSTIVPGTIEDIVIPLLEQHSEKKAGTDFGVCMNPEFLREGKAVEDFMNPDRVIIGEYDEQSGDVVSQLNNSGNCPHMRTTLKTAEMIKYASNAFLATKISFINEIGNLCKIMGIDSYDVSQGMGMDHRISQHFLRAGLGFGGSCFPKDVKALVATAKKQHSNTELLDAVLSVNMKQRTNMRELAESKIDSWNGKTVALLGLAFKQGTDDIRESPALTLIEELQSKGATIQAYDPKAMENMKKEYPNLTYTASSEAALKGADICLIVTNWPEFKNLDFSSMKSKIVIDGRRIVQNREGLDYEGLCW